MNTEGIADKAWGDHTKRRRRILTGAGKPREQHPTIVKEKHDVDPHVQHMPMRPNKRFNP